MRVITGKYKGRHFDVPRSFKARPTTDFAKENIFNVLRSYTDFENQTVLDIFAGTGSISLEFLSRGCSRVVSIEIDRQHCAFLRTLFQKLGDPASCLLHADALRYLSKPTETFDIVFADPPYTLRELPSLPELVLQGNVLKPEGLFILEHGSSNDFSKHPFFIEHRVYGSVNFTIFRKHAQ